MSASVSALTNTTCLGMAVVAIVIALRGAATMTSTISILSTLITTLLAKATLTAMFVLTAPIEVFAMEGVALLFAAARRGLLTAPIRARTTLMFTGLVEMATMMAVVTVETARDRIKRTRLIKALVLLRGMAVMEQFGTTVVGQIETHGLASIIELLLTTATIGIAVAMFTMALYSLRRVRAAKIVEVALIGTLIELLGHIGFFNEREVFLKNKKKFFLSFSYFKINFNTSIRLNRCMKRTHFSAPLGGSQL